MSARARRALSAGTLYPLVLFDGDSLTIGANVVDANGLTYPYQTMQKLSPFLDSANLGLGGQFIATMLANAPAKIDAAGRGRPRAVVAYWGGTNDISLGGYTAAQTYANTVAYGQGRQAAGFRVAVLTMLPRTGDTIAGFETARQSVNASIRANWATFADALIDVGNDTTIGQAGQDSNLTYYLGDGIHLNEAGYAIVAGLAATAIAGLL